MFRPVTSSVLKPAPRRGALLIAVLGLLTLFAIFALFFVFYADAEATSARIHREAQSPGPDGDYLDASGDFNLAMGLILFDDTDLSTGVLNPLRGHSLSRSMYGGRQGPSEPFSGIGTFHEISPIPVVPSDPTDPTGLKRDRALWINYSAPFRTSAGPVAGDNTYFLDPEYNGFRLGALAGPSAQVIGNQLPASLNHTFIPKNAPYTYPDLKDLILASLSPATGEVLVPSLHRNWLFNAGNPNTALRLAPWNPNDTAPASNTVLNTDWVTPEGRTRILRPRPVDQLITELVAAGLYPIPPGLAGWSAAQKNTLYNLITSSIAAGKIIGYPAPNADGSYSGDVQNLQGGVGVQKNDSILVDLGLQPKQWRGKWIKPLASILLTDLDGLLNINVHGNIRGPGSPGSHSSHNGFGPHEVNLGYLLGNAEAANVVQSRYGISTWSPNTPYSPGARVVNYGNFYVCVGPMGGGTSGPAPGPTGYGASAMDGSVQWSELTVSIPRNGAGGALMDPSGRRAPLHSAVNFDGGGDTPTITYPSFPGNGFQTSIQYSNTGLQSFFDDNVADAPPTDTHNKYLNHPLLWNPNDWGSGNATRRWYPFSDLKRFNIRYAADRDWYTQTDVWAARTANASLIGSSAAGPAYRLDPAHTNHGLVTTISTSLDRGGILGNFNSSAGGQVLVLPNGQRHPVNGSFTGIFSPGTGADYAGNLDWRNPRAALGPVDVNRPLADYRDLSNAPNVTVMMGIPTATPQPLGPTNNANFKQAWADRHNLARDIFARLILATGANATVDATGNVTISPVIAASPGNPDYNALRYLAQLAANAVDAIDGDDIATVFVWNPTNGAPNSNGPLGIVDASGGATDVQNFVTLNTALPTDISNRVVIGVEKPRLVINEAYGEITNDPGESSMMLGAADATMDGRVRFWVELLNPTGTPYQSMSPPGVLGDGSVQLRNGGGVSGYRLVISRNSRGGVGNAIGDLLKPDNVTGSLTSLNPDLICDFSTAGVGAQQKIMPNSNRYTQLPGSATTGVLLVGPQLAASAGPAVAAEYNPKNAAGAGPQWTGMLEVPEPAAGAAPQNGMSYTLPVNSLSSMFLQGQEPQRHVVMLQRLANPYSAFNAQTNPYITVDYMDWVQAFDAVVWAKPNRGAMGYSTMTSRYSIGKVQPYAGIIPAGGANSPQYPAAAAQDTFLTFPAFPNTFVLPQNPNPASASDPKHTFGYQNGRTAAGPAAQTYTTAPLVMAAETLMAPFDVFTHPDRPLVNQLELLSLQAVKPHEVTQYFLQNVAGALNHNQGLAPWLGVDPAGVPGTQVTPTAALSNNGLYRALESLRVKPWMYGAPHGGKVHGKININTIQDPRVLQALLDARTGNYFTAAEVNAVWDMINPATANAGVPYRTQQHRTLYTANNTAMNVPLPGPTYDDLPDPSAAVYDRPFRSLGAAEFVPDISNMAFAARFGTGLQDTLLRVWPASAGPPLAGQPMIWSTNANVNINGQPNTGLQSEMLRKMFNNTTTTSHAFAVTITIVYHEVRLNGANPAVVNEGAGNRYLLGKEAFKDSPGDLRQQFYSVVDRSNLVLNTSGAIHSPLPFQQPTESLLLNASLASPVLLGNYNAPTGPVPSGFNNNPPNSYNVYLDNSTSSGGGSEQYGPSTGFFTTTVYVDSKPFIIRPGMQLLFGVGTNQEAVTVNHVNRDGSLNIGGTQPGQTPFGRSHAAGDLVSNYLPGNPGPVSTLANPNPSNPGPFELMIPSTQPSSYRGIVPYAVRVR